MDSIDKLLEKEKKESEEMEKNRSISMGNDF